MSTTIQTSGANNQSNVVPTLYSTRESNKTLSMKHVQHMFMGRKEWDIDKVENVAPAEKDGVPTEAEEVTAEASATSAGGRGELGQCCHFGKKGNKSIRCQNMATINPYSRGVNSHLVYYEACNGTCKLKEKKREVKRRKILKEGKIKEENSLILNVVERRRVPGLGGSKYAILSQISL